MTKAEKDFRNAAGIPQPRKAAKVLWGCAKAMTQEERTKLYKSLEKEHVERCQILLARTDLPRIMQEQLEQKLHRFPFTLEAKALKKFGMDF